MVVWGRMLIALVVLSLCGACSDDGDEPATIVGPGLEAGAGRIYPIRDVVFSSRDGVPVHASWGTRIHTEQDPVVILLHDLDGDRKTWLTRTLLPVALLERNYAVLCLDLRGSGETPLPEGRSVTQVADLEASYRDVQGALDWLRLREDVDGTRVAVVGSGSGGNVAFVSMGLLGDRIRTGVALSPGLWDRNTLRPLVVGADEQDFAPRSLLFVAGVNDTLATGRSDPSVLSYADFARGLADLTEEPSSVMIVPGSAKHGLDLLNSEPAVLQSILQWLGDNL